MRKAGRAKVRSWSGRRRDARGLEEDAAISHGMADPSRARARLLIGWAPLARGGPAWPVVALARPAAGRHRRAARELDVRLPARDVPALSLLRRWCSGSSGASAAEATVSRRPASRAGPRPARARSCRPGRPPPSARTPSAACESGKTRSIRGRRRPDATAWRSARNSRSLAIVEPRIEICFQKIRRISSLGFGPDVAPQVTMRPPLAHGLQRRHPRLLADRVDDDVDAALGGVAAHGLPDVLRRVVDDQLGAGLARPRAPSRARRSSRARARRRAARSRAPRPPRRRRRRG